LVVSSFLFVNSLPEAIFPKTKGVSIVHVLVTNIANNLVTNKNVTNKSVRKKLFNQITYWFAYSKETKFY
ncbi:MAG: hypothetical protein ABR597_10815, partial [Bacteroidales bacterium]